MDHDMDVEHEHDEACGCGEEHEAPAAAAGGEEVGKDVDVSPAKDGGVMKKILVAGSGWEKPRKGSDVNVHYVGTLLDGTVFDSSRERGTPFTFKLGEGQVIKGWDAGVATMKKGEKAVLTCKPEYAYGSREQGKIPPNSTLIFEVELLSWVDERDISDAKVSLWFSRGTCSTFPRGE
jgi:FK506-binding protein 4/5